MYAEVAHPKLLTKFSDPGLPRELRPKPHHPAHRQLPLYPLCLLRLTNTSTALS